MKNSLCRSLAAALIAASLTLNAHAETSAGQVDFGQFTAPAKGGEFVEIHLKSNLLGLAAQLLGKAEPDAAKILSSVESVRVNVIGLNSENRKELYDNTLKGRLNFCGVRSRRRICRSANSLNAAARPMF